MVLTPGDAYARCEEITRREALNFYYGIRLLPLPKRRALSAVYALARRIDDVGDGELPKERKLAVLAELHEVIDDLAAGRVADAADPVLVGVAHAAAVFPIPVSAFGEIVQGCEHDAAGRSYQSMDDTVEYCRLVAGSVGRISLGVFGVEAGKPPLRVAGQFQGSQASASPEKLADDLGVALQLTNILRDVVEDRRLGRNYLPARELERFGVAEGSWEPPEAAGELIRFMACVAVAWFERGLKLLDFLDRRSRACTAAMAGIYRRVLERIRFDPQAPLRGRISLSGPEKALVAARSLAGLRP